MYRCWFDPVKWICYTLSVTVGRQEQEEPKPLSHWIKTPRDIITDDMKVIVLIIMAAIPAVVMMMMSSPAV